MCIMETENKINAQYQAVIQIKYQIEKRHLNQM